VIVEGSKALRSLPPRSSPYYWKASEHEARKGPSASDLTGDSIQTHRVHLGVTSPVCYEKAARANGARFTMFTRGDSSQIWAREIRSVREKRGDH